MARKQVYELLFSFEAPDILKTEQTGLDITQFFEEKQLVIGEPYEKEYVIIEERYIIPLDYLKKSDKIPYLKKESRFDDTVDRIKQQSIELSEKEAEKLKKVGTDIKDVVEGKTKSKIEAEAKSYKGGALVGLASGVLLALYFKKNIWAMGFIGLAVGGYVTHQIRSAKSGKGFELNEK
jgi:hypothetical protein